MEFSFPHYLLSKQSVDDRALNKDVLTALRASLPEKPLRIIEVGGGIGTMPARLLRWGDLSRAEYTLVDSLEENISFAREWLPEWAQENGLSVKEDRSGEIELFDEGHSIHIKLVHADLFDFIAGHPEPADLLIAHAFLDLLPMPGGLRKLLTLTGNLAWLTLNFDGVSSLEPVIDTKLDAKIEQLYHHSMDSRPGGGDSRSGRHLFGYLEQAGAEIVSAGASDWVVYPVDKRYPAEEVYFLQFILHFFEESLSNHPDLDAVAFSNWLMERRQQIDSGKLIYIAHQMDFLCKSPLSPAGRGQG